jgi:hydrogenase maturation protease
MKPRKSLVVALGNPLMGPDGFGAAVLERVRLLPGLSEVADVLDAHTDLLGQLDRLARYQRVVLIDSILGGKSSGVRVYAEEQFADWPDASPGCHQLSPLAAVKLLRRLHPGAVSQVVLVGWSVDEVARDAGVPDAAVEQGARVVARLVGLTAAPNARPVPPNRASPASRGHPRSWSR